MKSITGLVEDEALITINGEEAIALAEKNSPTYFSTKKSIPLNNRRFSNVAVITRKFFCTIPVKGCY